MVDRSSSFWRSPRGIGVLFLSFVGVVLLLSAANDAWTEGASADPDGRPGHPQVFLAVDGLSWEAFQEAKSRGMFARFPNAGRLIAPYPSMSHPSWTEVMGTRRLFGARGNVRTVEARWFDLEAMRVYDDPREVIARQAGAFNYMRAFDTYFDPLIEPLMYFPGRRLFDREIEETERDILKGADGGQYAAYVSGSDALAHIHKDSLYSYLTRLDAALTRVVDSLVARDSTTRVWIVSDHGNAGGFVEGERESYLTPVSLEGAARRAGLTFRDSGTVTDSNSVAVVTIALASMINAYFPDLSRRRQFATEALKEEGVTLVTWLEVQERDRYIVVLSQDGEAELRWSGDSIEYRVKRGNPLEIPREFWSSSARVVRMHDSVSRRITQDGRWPDAPHRLIASASKQVENAPDLIVNLGDAYCAKGEFGRIVRMVRTHGSLSARATFGVIAGTKGTIPSHVRADEAMRVMQLDERAMFRKVDATYLAGHDVALSHARDHRAIASGRRDHSVDAEFLRRAQPVVQSMGYFPWSSVRDIWQLVSKLSRGGNSNVGALSKVAKIDVLSALSEGVDPLLELGDSLKNTKTDALLQEVTSFTRTRSDLAPLTEVLEAWSKKSGAAAPDAAVGIDELVVARKLAMTAWTIPPFLDAALVAPEEDSIPDTRDLAFAERWIATEKADFRNRPERVLWNAPFAGRLFNQVFAERKLLRKTGAGAMPLIYTEDPGAVTVVLLPGIYTELFDDEIWQRGLRSVRDNLGMRTMSVPLDGRCASDVNAEQLLAALRTDTRRRLERGYDSPRYLLLGYSKGGVDAVHALVSDSVFAQSQIAALVTIATPHGGSPVPERADLPSLVSERSTNARVPEACRTRTAASSISPQAQSDFWTRHAATVGLRTRLFSLSLVSTVEDAHPWMKITKRIGEFSEPNDGVVARSASHFPASVPAVHLGEYDGDHIAGRRASTFPQEAFLESIVVTLAELGALDARGDVAARTARRDWLQRRVRVAGNGTMAADFTSDLRPATALPGGSSGWTPTATFRTFDATLPGAREVGLATPALAPTGIAIRCDQRNMRAFRTEYEFAYDGGNGGAENNLDNGFSLVADADTKSKRACRLATRGAAIKMTTVSLRFRPVDFPALDFRVRVAENVKAVDPTARRRGANDAAFKLWFVLRDVRNRASGENILFGYTWNAVDTAGRLLPDGAFVEALSSKRSLVVKTLPEAWLVAIGNTKSTDWQQFQRDLAADVARAYPTIPTSALEVVAVTIQSDSDESNGRSLSLLDYISVAPRTRVAAKP